AYDAGCRTRRIDQNAIEAAFVPPAVRLRGIADDQLRLEVEALKARADPAQALAVDIQGRQLDVATLENMGGLAAGCRAGVEHALAGAQVQIVGRQLGRAILNGDTALVE